MSQLEALLAQLENTAEFDIRSDAFLKNREVLIDTLIDEKNIEALTELLEQDKLNLALLNNKLEESSLHINNVNKIGKYIT